MNKQQCALPIRRELLRHWRGAGRDRLADCLRQGDDAGFDQHLLDDVAHRTQSRFYFRPQDVPGRLRQARRTARADVALWLRNADLVMQHKFPVDDRLDVPRSEWIQLPRNFPWLRDPRTRRKGTWRHPFDICHILNRHRFWPALAFAYHLTGKTRYTDELKRQFFSWTRSHPPLANPRESTQHYPQWHLLDSAIRGDTWPWTFFLLIGTEAWTPEFNTLFLHQLWQHGRFLDQLYPLCIRGHGGNWTIMQAQGLLNIALLFPEYKESPRWERQAQTALTACLQRQFLPDGGHVEQSPSYHEGSLRWMCEPLYLAQLNGRAWAGPLMARLRRSAECLFQVYQPDGHNSLLSDSDRNSEDYFAGLSWLLGEPKWLRFGKPGLREALMFGKTQRRRHSSRPTVMAFRDSGYYVLRSGDRPQDLQIVFDCGLQGGSHGHFDLLSFELCGFGKPLICDPGRLNYNLDHPDRRWIISTPAHNTISLDGLNHERFETVHDRRFQVTAWKVRHDHVHISAQHRGYASLPGRPVVGRRLWYNRQRVVVLRDWGRSETEHDYTIAFTLPGRAVARLPAGGICTTQARGNVLIRPLLGPGQTTACETRFWSPNYGQKEPAIRFTVRQRARCVAFTTLIVAYPGAKPPQWAVGNGHWNCPDGA